MRRAETVVSVLRERGRRGLPVERLYRMMFNRELFLMAYGRIYSNQGAMWWVADRVDAGAADRPGAAGRAVPGERAQGKDQRYGQR